MSRFRQLLALLLVGAGVAAWAADPPATPPVPTDPTTGEKFDPAKVRFVGEQVGKVVKVSGGDSGSLTLRVGQFVPRTSVRQPVRQVVQDVELPLAKDVAVRAMKLTDDNGKPRQATAEEQKQLKGPGNVPGFRAEFSKVRADDDVRVHLVQPKRPKDAKPTDPMPKPLVAMIVILNEAPAKK